MSQRFCRFYHLNPVSIKNMLSLESLFRSSVSQGYNSRSNPLLPIKEFKGSFSNDDGKENVT